MVRAEQKPGRRRAEPPPRRLRRSRKPEPPPRENRLEETLRPPRPARPSLARRALPVLARILWLLLFFTGLGAVVVPWTPVEAPGYVPLAGAVALTTLFTHGLAVRTGGRPLVSGGLALLLASLAVLTGSAVLLAGATVGTAVVAALLAILSTKPAAKFSLVVREVLVAALVVVVGAFAVAAYDAEVSLVRTSYLVIGFSLLGALALVYRLGAGLQGLGRRGLVMIVSGVVLLTVTLAYTQALATWGSPGMIETVDRTFAELEDLFGAVPRPIEVLLGFPALAWGVSTRARRRQGWWVCAFGAPGLSVITVSLLDPELTLFQAGLSVLYSLVLGLVVGYAIIRADLFLTGARGRRARRLEELAAHRPEPGRLQPLL